MIGAASAPPAIMPPESTSARRRGRISLFILLPPLFFSCGGFYTGRGGTHLRHPAPRLGPPPPERLTTPGKPRWSAHTGGGQPASADLDPPGRPCPLFGRGGP